MSMNLLVEPEVVRGVTGISDEYDVSDEYLQRITEYAQRYCMRVAYEKHFQEEPDPNPDTGSYIDGSNTLFRTKAYPIADITFDEEIDSEDISGVWIDEDWGVNTASITVVNRDYGIIRIYQDDGSTAIPSSAKYIYLTYYSEPANFDIELFIQAVIYFAAHCVENMLKGQEKITLADLESNKQIIQRKTQFYDLYLDVINKISTPKVAGT